MALDSGKKMRKPVTGDAASNGYGRTGKMKNNSKHALSGCTRYGIIF